MLLYEISGKTKISINTVTKYLNDMRKRQALLGPYLQLKPNTTHPEYINLVSFSSPRKTFNSFKGFPHVTYYARCLGDWNFLLVTNRLLDFSQLVGFTKMHYCSKREFTWDAPAYLTTWDNTVSEIDSWLQNPRKVKIPHIDPIEILWKPHQWKLYWRVKDFVRVEAATLKRELKISYEAYIIWKKSLSKYTQTFVGYYPYGLPSYTVIYFLLETDEPGYITAAFQNWPTTPTFTQTENRLLLMLALPGGMFLSRIFDLFDEMISEGFLASYEHALLLDYWKNDLSSQVL